MNADVVTARSSKEKARDARLLQHVLHPLEEPGVKPIDSHNAHYGTVPRCLPRLSANRATVI
jgi:hypothetical protein